MGWKDDANADCGELTKRWPEVFDPKRRRPLAIGIHVAIGEATGWDPTRLARALRWWTGAAAYLKAMIPEGAMRHNLDGKPVEPVSEQHRIDARAWLDAMDRKAAARKAEAKVSGKPVSSESLPTMKTGRSGRPILSLARR